MIICLERRAVAHPEVLLARSLFSPDPVRFPVPSTGGDDFVLVRICACTGVHKAGQDESKAGVET